MNKDEALILQYSIIEALQENARKHGYRIPKRQPPDIQMFPDKESNQRLNELLVEYM